MMWHDSAESAFASTLGLEPVSGFEYPRHDRQRYRHEHDRHGEADSDAHVGDAVEAPAEAADQIDHRVEQRDRLPQGRQHIDRIEAASQKGQRSDDQQWYELQLFETVGPDADDEADETERYRREHEKENHPQRMRDSERHEQSGGRQDDETEDDRLGRSGADVAHHDLEIGNGRRKE